MSGAGWAGRRRAAVAVLLVVPLAAGCTGSPGSGGSTTLPKGGAAATGVTPVRWWSNGQVKAGSTIALSAPDSAAGRLHRSRGDYCSMLTQTVAAGRSILPGVTAEDPARLASTKAFVAEIQHVTPKPLAASWQVLGSAMIALVASGGNAARVVGVDAAAVQKAVSVVADDARSACGVDLASKAKAAK